MKSNDDYLKMREVAAILNCSMQHVYKLANDGALPVMKVGRQKRVSRANFARFVEDSPRSPRKRKQTMPQFTTIEYLTADEAAAILKVSTKTIIRRFEKRAGVIDIGSGEGRFKQRYRVLRIPRETLEKFIAESSIQ